MNGNSDRGTRGAEWGDGDSKTRRMHGFGCLETKINNSFCYSQFLSCLPKPFSVMAACHGLTGDLYWTIHIRLKMLHMINVILKKMLKNAILSFQQYFTSSQQAHYVVHYIKRAGYKMSAQQCLCTSSF